MFSKMCNAYITKFMKSSELPNDIGPKSMCQLATEMASGRGDVFSAPFLGVLSLF